MYRLLKKSMFIMIFVFTGLTLLMSGVQAQEVQVYIPDDVSLQSSQDVMALWTAEKMQNAIPSELLVV